MFCIKYQVCVTFWILHHHHHRVLLYSTTTKTGDRWCETNVTGHIIGQEQWQKWLIGLVWTTRGLQNAFCPWVWLDCRGSDSSFAQWPQWYSCRHVVKYSAAFRHEWHVRRTVVLVFSTKPWREQKGHLLATITNVRVGCLHPVEELQATPEALVHIWTSQLELCLPCPHFVVKFMKAAGIVPPIPFIYGLAVSCACSIKFILLCSDSLCILESSYSPPSVTQRQHLVPPNWAMNNWIGDNIISSKLQ